MPEARRAAPPDDRLHQEVRRMLKGRVKWFHDAKGYGFIETDEGRDVFVHYSAINSDGYKTLAEGQPVRFEVVQTPKGLQAHNVTMA
jgi:CspA family cold shock protein